MMKGRNFPNLVVIESTLFCPIYFKVLTDFGAGEALNSGKPGE